jgi:hypothetical protein
MEEETAEAKDRRRRLSTLSTHFLAISREASRRSASGLYGTLNFDNWMIAIRATDLPAVSVARRKPGGATPPFTRRKKKPGAKTSGPFLSQMPVQRVQTIVNVSAAPGD